MSRRLAALLLAVLVGPCVLNGGETAPLEDSVVILSVTHQSYNSHHPWQKTRPGTRDGYGAVIGPSLILTTEDFVRGHTFIQFWQPRRGKRFTARVEMADEQVNLALLRVVETAEPPSLTPLTVLKSVPRDSKLEIVQADDTSEIQRGEGHVVQVLVDQLPESSFSSLIFRVLTDLNVQGRSALALHDGQLAGLVMSYDAGQRMGRMLPASVLTRFIDDAANSPYQGVPIAGFSWAPLIDPVKRRFLNVTDAGRGVIVKSVLPETGATDIVKPNDVILEWDGHPITEMGFYDDEELGRLKFPHLIKGYHRPGDQVSVTLISERERKTVSLTLTRYADESAYVPESIAGARPSYIVDGGLVIRELDAAYLKSYGDNWHTRVDSRLAHIYNTQALAPAVPGSKVLILASVLPDPINVGYQHFFNQIIESVNGRPVQNIDDVFELLVDGHHITRLTLRSNGLDIVLDEEQMEAANKRIFSAYRIAETRYRPAESGQGK